MERASNSDSTTRVTGYIGQDIPRGGSLLSLLVSDPGDGKAYYCRIHTFPRHKLRLSPGFTGAPRLVINVVWGQILPELSVTFALPVFYRAGSTLACILHCQSYLRR